MCRFIAIATFGPHMLFVGERFRKKAREERKEVREFAEATRARRKEILAEHKKRMLEEAQEKKLAMEAWEDSGADGGKRDVVCCRFVPSWLRCSLIEQCCETVDPNNHATEHAGYRLSHSGYHHLLVQPRPTAARLRVRFTPDRTRSSARPMNAAEKRPKLYDRPPRRMSRDDRRVDRGSLDA